MRRSFAHDLKTVLAGCVLWLAFIVSGAVTWGWFIPLIVACVVVPAVLVSLLEGPWLWRPFLGSLPSCMAAVATLLLGTGPHSWAPLIAQLIGGGAVVVFLLAMPIAIWRHLRPNNSFKPKPLRGSA